ncbi:MAG TPA: hypothetical protein VGI64_09695, partial [Streptosporangiaceae bacterium]
MAGTVSLARTGRAGQSPVSPVGGAGQRCVPPRHVSLAAGFRVAVTISLANCRAAVITGRPITVRRTTASGIAADGQVVTRRTGPAGPGATRPSALAAGRIARAGGEPG